MNRVHVFCEGQTEETFVRFQLNGSEHGQWVDVDVSCQS
jgi:hypothetical protein